MKINKSYVKEEKKEKSTQLYRTQKAELKALAQKKCKHVQKIDKKYGHGNMTSDGWYRIKGKKMWCKRKIVIG